MKSKDDKHFKVVWNIDEFTDTPLNAAKLAFEDMQQPTSANYFIVLDTETKEAWEVDLEEDTVLKVQDCLKSKE